MAGGSPETVLKIVQNPVYAVDIDPSLFVRSAEKMPRDEWIRANARLMEDVGAEQWLTSLLEVLEGDYPRGQGGAAFGFTRTPPRRP
jgi:hypothetical protein